MYKYKVWRSCDYICVEFRCPPRHFVLKRAPSTQYHCPTKSRMRDKYSSCVPMQLRDNNAKNFSPRIQLKRVSLDLFYGVETWIHFVPDICHAFLQIIYHFMRWSWLLGTWECTRVYIPPHCVGLFSGCFCSWSHFLAVTFLLLIIVNIPLKYNKICSFDLFLKYL
jgi:hypothetical protein